MFSKIAKKKIKGKCCICEIENYSILDCHRLDPGSKYTDWGTIVVCSNCHRKIHNEEILVLSKNRSTMGEVLTFKIAGESQEIMKEC